MNCSKTYTDTRSSFYFQNCHSYSSYSLAMFKVQKVVNYVYFHIDSVALINYHGHHMISLDKKKTINDTYKNVSFIMMNTILVALI